MMTLYIVWDISTVLTGVTAFNYREEYHVGRVILMGYVTVVGEMLACATQTAEDCLPRQDARSTEFGGTRLLVWLSHIMR